jgi:hypothetical protein
MKGSSKIITVITFFASHGHMRLVAPYHGPYHVISPLRFSQFPTFHRLHTEIDIGGSIRLKDAVDLLDVRPRAVGKLPSIAKARPDHGRTVGKTWLENHGWRYHPPCYKLVSLK